MRKHFDEQLEEMNRELTAMGELCRRAIALSCEALTSGDKVLAERVVGMDPDIDQKERLIESMCLKILLQQQPVARDLRQISAALKMITDLERIGDQAADIAEIITFMGDDLPESLTHIPQITHAVIKMVNDSVEAYVEHDLKLAQEVIDYDDVVDNYFREVKEDLIELIAAKPEDGEEALDLLMIAKYFERIGDHATNVAEWAVFSVTGEHPTAHMD